MTRIVLRGGDLVTASGLVRKDLAFDSVSGLIVEVADHIDVSQDDIAQGRAMDIDGCWVSSGFVDLHCHLGEPGDEGAETILSGSRAGAIGGYTALLAMPTTDPCVDSAGAVLGLQALARSALCEIVPMGMLSVGGAEDALAPAAEMAEFGVQVFTDGGHGVQDAGFLRRALDYVDDLRSSTGQPCLVAQPCDLRTLSKGGQMHEGAWSSRLGLAGIPAAAEEIMVAQTLRLARLCDTRVHLQHLSTAVSFELVRNAKEEGIQVSIDVSPHHLIFQDGECASYDSRFKFRPPLRSEADVEAARFALLDGTIDAVASGHRPVTSDQKERPFDQAPSGAVSLDIVLSVLVGELGLEPEVVARVLSWTPARIAGLHGQHGCSLEQGMPANLAVVNPKATRVIGQSSPVSRSTNTPFHGRTMTGNICHTVWKGDFVVRNSEITR